MTSPHTECGATGRGGLRDEYGDTEEEHVGSGRVARSLNHKVLVWCHPKAVDRDTRATGRNVAAYAQGPVASGAHSASVEIYCW
jgi:hypothetical protein